MTASQQRREAQLASTWRHSRALRLLAWEQGPGPGCLLDWCTRPRVFTVKSTILNRAWSEEASLGEIDFQLCAKASFSLLFILLEVCHLTCDGDSGDCG